MKLNKIKILYDTAIYAIRCKLNHYFVLVMVAHRLFNRFSDSEFVRKPQRSFPLRGSAFKTIAGAMNVREKSEK